MDGRRLIGLARAAAMLGAPANDNVPGTITPDDVPFFLALGMTCAAIVALAVYVGMSGPNDAIAALRGSMDEPPRYDGDARKAPPAYVGGIPGRDGDGVGHRAPSIKRSPARPGPLDGGSGRCVAVSTSGPARSVDPRCVDAASEIRRSRSCAVLRRQASMPAHPGGPRSSATA